MRLIGETPTFMAKFGSLELWRRMKLLYVLLGAVSNIDFLEKLIVLAENNVKM